MKLSNFKFLGVVFLVLTQLFFISKVKFTYAQSSGESWKNFYGIVWDGTPEGNIRFARQMGQDHIGIQMSPSYYRNNRSVAGLKFYVDNPRGRIHSSFGYSKTINLSRVTDSNTSNDYTQAERNFYERNMVWKSRDPFPYNLATGWWHSRNEFSVIWDFQQQAVIDMLVEEIIALFRSYEDRDLPFTFAGFIDDVPGLAGDFNIWDNNARTGNRAVELSYWTGTDSGLIHSGITHEYATFEDGMAAYYKKLNARMRQEFPDAKWIAEPTVLYSSGSRSEYIYSTSQRADRDELTPDMLFSEGPNTAFVDDERNFNSGMDITRDMVGISQVQRGNEADNRLFAGKAGINGAWYNFLWRWGGANGDGENEWSDITQVYPRQKLIRYLPNWDNLNGVPLSSRSWNGSVYQSTHSFASSDLIYSRQPNTGKLFAVFLTRNGVIRLNAGETITSIRHVNGYFEETTDASADFNITGSEIRLRSSVTIDIDTRNGRVMGNGYIFTLSGGRSGVPVGSISINSGNVYTDSTAVTLRLSATDNGGVTGYYLSTSSTVPSLSTPGWTTVASTTSYNASVSYTLSSGDGSKTVYVWYRDGSGNISTTASDSITLDTTDPTVTITSPTSNATYTTTSSTINLGGSASDSRSGVSSVTWRNDRGGSGTASGTTSWSITGIRLSSGSNIITVTATDGANNSSTDTITITSNSTTADTTAPNCSITINGGASYTSSTGVTLALSATDNVGVTGYYLSTSSVTPLLSSTGWTSITSTASYSASVPYTLSSGDGSKTLYVWYRDAAGNVSTPASDSIILDTTELTITITSPTSNDTYRATGSTINLAGSASGGVSRVTWSNDRGGGGTASGTTSWSISGVSLSGGRNTITVTATDGANNTTTDTITVTYQPPPEGSISINSAASYTNSTAVTLTLSATDNVGVAGYYLSASSVRPLASDPGWTTIASTTNYNASVPYTLSSGDGNKTVYVWYKDVAENISDTASDSIVLDSTDPTVTITSPTTNATYRATGSTINLAGGASDSRSGVSRVTWRNNRGGSGTASGTTSWSISGINLSLGENIITVTASDRANNTRTDTITVTR